ncbi:putative ABC transporter peptide-binding protein YtcQ [Paenibacillus sp. J31TS4]|uniref:extracellular solute-binding protein n=1 Tax=Paenibacillus sp. J31TS4 TaxID=2807195 RepID=UPI001B2CDD6E|nr:extracellular solute-binding protein [Paenibacillus sp. J31TS4]GIP38006.1 putative ABC transporter peptide-binding protein YtcQ [Paenibacillus sp. J31TS4]
MKTKWTLFGGVLALASLTAAAGCGSDADAPKADANGTKGEEKTITYQFMRNLSAETYPADGGEARTEILSRLEKAGIRGFDYKVTLASGDDYNTKLNLLATSGTLPDFFDIDAKTLARFVDQGLIQPLDDYLKQAPNLMKVVPKSNWDQVTFNGKIYALPNGKRPEPFNLPSVTGLVVRQDWLDNLGMKQPTTLDELHEVLKAFVTKDPDKNGKNDTVGLTGMKDSSFQPIFGAYGIIPTFWLERDGQIKKGLVLPEMKEALTLLQQWYKEGLIDHDFPIMETKQMEEKIVNSIAGMFEGSSFYTEKSGNSASLALNKLNPKSQLNMLEAPIGPGGKRGYPEGNAVAAAPLRALSAKAPNPAKLFEYLNWTADTEDTGGSMLVSFGKEGTDYTFDKATNSIDLITPYADLYKKGFSNPIRMVYITDRRSAKPEIRHSVDIVNKTLIINQLWNSLPAEVDYPDLEKKLWREYLVKIVTGVWSVDKYDEFIQKYYAQGGKEVEKQANELWKSLNKK